MSIFRLNEIQFTDDFNRDDNDSTSISGSRFDINNHRYPNDLGSSRNNHYMLFEIFVRENINSDFNVQISGEDPVDYVVRRALSRSRGSGQSLSSTFGQSLDSLLSGRLRNFTQDRNSDFSGRNSASTADDELNIRGYWDNEPPLTSLYDDPSILGNSDLANAIRTRASGLADRLFQRLRNDISKSFNTLKKARESIALYIPDTLNFDYAHNYNDLELSRNPFVAMAQSAAIGASIMGPRSDVSGISPFVAEIISSLPGGAGLPGSLEAIGVAINPQYEVVFQSTSLRNFRFDFMFYPRDEREAESVYKIIRAFKFHAAPEIVSGGGGRYLLAPSAFDISFFYNGQINPNIPKISTCVCTSVETDYAPNGFSAYEVQNQPNPSIGKTGSPVSVRLSLQFKEMTMITKELLRGDTVAGLNDALGGNRGSF